MPIIPIPNVTSTFRLWLVQEALRSVDVFKYLDHALSFSTVYKRTRGLHQTMHLKESLLRPQPEVKEMGLIAEGFGRFASCSLWAGLSKKLSKPSQRLFSAPKNQIFTTEESAKPQRDEDTIVLDFWDRRGCQGRLMSRKKCETATL